MPTLVTLAGIDQALTALDLKPGTLKALLAEAIRSSFPDEESLQSITAIPTDDLVKKVYGVSKAADLKAKKKNFSSLKSGLNKSLRDLDGDQNPEGVIIGRDNAFIVSDERKDNLIRELGLAAESTQTLREMFKSFKSLFNEVIKEKGVHEVHDLIREFDETRKLIEQLGGGLPEATEAAPLTEIGAEEVEIVSGEDLEEVEAAPAAEEIEELGEDVEIVEADEVEEVEAPQELTEELPAGEVVEIPAEELEEVEELPPAAEKPAEVAPEEIEEVSEEEIAKAEEVPPVAEEIEELGEGVEVVEADEVEEAEAPEELAEEVPPGEVEEIPVEELEEVEELPPAGKALEEIAEVEEMAPEEIEELSEDELEELAETSPAAGEAEELGEGVEMLEADEVEEVEAPEELVEELPAGEVEEIPAEELKAVEERSPAGEALEEVAPEELEEVSEEEIAEVEGVPPAAEAEAKEAPEEVEEIGEDELEEIEEVPAEEARKPGPLDLLSKYLEADEAVAAEGDYLKETDEEYAAQILNRFMPKFVHIPAGDYLVGSAQPKGLEQPQRRIALPAYYLGQFPVTNDLFELFVRETGYETEAEAAGYGLVFEGRCVTTLDPTTGRATVTLAAGTSAHHVSGASWRHPHGPESTIEGKHLHPVVQVSHKDAMAFAAWAGKRLPTEEEWEAAARGPHGLLFPWGNSWLPKLANFESSCLGDTMPVDRHGREAMSHFGIHDLLGNVYEWTATIHQRPGTATTATSNVIYILKGGCWTSRGMISASHREIERGHYWSNTIGFRCAV